MMDMSVIMLSIIMFIQLALPVLYPLWLVLKYRVTKENRRYILLIWIIGIINLTWYGYSHYSRLSIANDVGNNASGLVLIIETFFVPILILVFTYPLLLLIHILMIRHPHKIHSSEKA